MTNGETAFYPETQTADQLAEHFDLPLDLIRSWAKRKQITAYDWIFGRGRGGRVAIYVVSEVEVKVTEWREQAAKREARRAAKR